MRAIGFVLVAALLGGCVPSQKLSVNQDVVMSRDLMLMPRGGGATGIGTAYRGGDIAITVGGKTYKGTFVIVPSGGGAMITNTMHTAPGAMPAYSSGVSAVASNGGTGNALLRAADGSGMRCQFQYSGTDAYGVCQDDKGKLFDAQTLRPGW